MKPLYTGSEWSVQLIETLWDHIDDIGKNHFGLDYYEPQIEIISSEQMLNAYSSYAMPVLYNHWSFGKTFIQNERQYSKGMSGLAFEVVINTNPCIAYLMETNSATMQALVIAHACCGHNHFFKNNYLFTGWTDADTILDYLKFAKNYIKSCEEKYGEKEVEQLLDACHSLQNHGIDKYKKPTKLTSQLKYERQKKWEKYFESTFNDLWRTVPKQQQQQPQISRSDLPEENILYFIEKNSPILQDWQREIVRIVRKIAQYFYPQRQTSLLNEGFACVKGDTEYLSPTGWKRIDEYDGDLVAQYEEDRSIHYVKPTKYIVNENKDLIEFDSEGFNQCVTPDHRMVYYSSRDNLNEIEAKDLDLSTSRSFISSGFLLSDSKIFLSEPQLRVMVAVCADGHFNPDTTTNHCQMAFVKQRKIDRLKRLLNLANIKYEIQEQTQGRTCFSFYAPHRNKSLAEYYGADHMQLSIILNEALYWDGCKSNDRKVYFGTCKESIEFLQYAGSMTEHKTSFKVRNTGGQRKALYSVELLKSKKLYLSGGTKKKLPGKHTVYCFSVPSGMFVTRRKNKISITGNCFTHHHIMTEMHDRGLIDEGAYLEFLSSHSSVVAQPVWNSKYFSGINIYALGFAMLMDIKRMCIEPDEEDKYWFPDICNTDWLATIKHIIENYRDESFVLQFLSLKVARRFKLFSFHMKENAGHLLVNGTHDDESFLQIRAALAEQYDLSRAVPQIEVVSVDWDTDRWLYLEHKTKNKQRMEYKNMRNTVSHIHSLWGFPVKMDYKDLDGNQLDEV